MRRPLDHRPAERVGAQGRAHAGDRRRALCRGGVDGWAPQSPVWYLNLKADPRVSLQDGPVLRDYLAREVEGEEKAEWWTRSTEVWPAYDDYQAATDRVIPLVVLDPVD